jgi:predicted transcriptional regulator
MNLENTQQATADIITAYVANNKVADNQLTKLIRNVFETLEDLHKPKHLRGQSDAPQNATEYVEKLKKEVNGKRLPPLDMLKDFYA